MVPSDDFLYHGAYLSLLVKVLLGDVTVTDFIEMVVFGLFVAHVGG